MFQSRYLPYAALVLWLFLWWGSVAEGATLSILAGQSHRLPFIKAIKAIEREYPAVAEAVRFRLLEPSEVSGLKPEGREELMVLYLMDSSVVAAAKPYVEALIRAGGKVYGVSEPYESEHKRMGILRDPLLSEYYDAGGTGNFKNMLLYLLSKEFSIALNYAMPERLPSMGIYIRDGHRWVEEIEQFLSHYNHKEGAPWVAVTFYRNYLANDDTAAVDAIIDGLEAAGLNVIALFGWPEEAMLKRYLLDGAALLKVDIIVALSMKIGVKASMVPLLEQIGAPVIGAISLYSSSQSQWLASEKGLSTTERSWQIATPELAGIIQPTVVASREPHTEPSTGTVYYRTEPIKERVDMLIRRVMAWLKLQRTANREKRIAILYYNYPPGKQNIGASYLNVIDSIEQIVEQLKKEGYSVTDGSAEAIALKDEIIRYGRNIGIWAGGELRRLVASGRAVLLAMDEYSRWFNSLPEGFRRAVIDEWGPPEDSTIMVWNREGRKYLVLPIIRRGNLLIAPQPARGWLQDTEKLYHSLKLPPHHQYIALYLYLLNRFKADAIVHLGTHGTHEWLSGKEAGLSPDDPPDVLVQHVPVIYPYIVDDVGEGLQAKRRGMAVVIDHMSPPFDRAGLAPELVRLKELINDYRSALSVGGAAADELLGEIEGLAGGLGILDALSIEHIDGGHGLAAIEDYIEELGRKLTPFGLHTFGRLPPQGLIDSTAAAMAEADPSKGAAHYRRLIERSAHSELKALVRALNGRYIAAATGGDPIRNPRSLPTGKNFYAFDPTKIPTPATYRKGVEMAEALLKRYMDEHGRLPTKVVINLWATETIRHAGVMESQIMALLGVKPLRNSRGRVVDVVAIPRGLLGRARIDVVVVPSGLYRDTFPELIRLIDRAVSVAAAQKEADNALRAHIDELRARLIKEGVEPSLARRLASVRIFTEPSGSYGTGIGEAVAKSDSWEDEKRLASLFLRRVGYLYGQGFWGRKAEAEGVELLRSALAGTSVVVHSLSGNLYATMDNDDMFQYLGGLALTVRAIDGRGPSVYITNLVEPDASRQESLITTITTESRTRYLNPRWIDSMLKQGYGGARFIASVVEHLWGWQVTVPQVVDERLWQAFYRAYVLDSYGLRVKQRMAEAKNLYAYQSLIARMLEAIRKGYWQADEAVVMRLVKEYTDTVEDVGLTCCDHTCNNPLLKDFIRAVMVSVPSLKERVGRFDRAFRATTTGGNPRGGRGGAKTDRTEQVEGYQMERLNPADKSSGSAPLPYLFIAGFIALLLVVYLGYKSRKLRR